MVKDPDASDLPLPITDPLESAETSTSASGSSFLGSASRRMTAPASDRGRVRGRLAMIPTITARVTNTPIPQITSFRLPLILFSVTPTSYFRSRRPHVFDYADTWLVFSPT